MFRRLVVFLALSLMAWAAALRAQELEPRAYSNLPIGMNFALAGYGYTEGAPEATSIPPALSGNTVGAENRRQLRPHHDSTAKNSTARAES